MVSLLLSITYKFLPGRTWVQNHENGTRRPYGPRTTLDMCARYGPAQCVGAVESLGRFDQAEVPFADQIPQR